MDVLCGILVCALGGFPLHFLFGCKETPRSDADHGVLHNLHLFVGLEEYFCWGSETNTMLAVVHTHGLCGTRKASTCLSCTWLLGRQALVR